MVQEKMSGHKKDCARPQIILDVRVLFKRGVRLALWRSLQKRVQGNAQGYFLLPSRHCVGGIVLPLCSRRSFSRFYAAPEAPENALTERSQSSAQE